MLIFNLLALLFFQPAAASYMDYRFFDNPEISVIRDDRQDISLKEVCSQMKYNYLEESERLKTLKAQLDWAVQQPLTDDQVQVIDNLKLSLRETTARLIHLANPEWNSEVMAYLIRWRLPAEYDSNEKNVIGAEVTAVYYKGDFAGYLAPQIKFYGIFPTLPYPPKIPGVPPPDTISRHIQFYSRGTYFELCQFLPTLQVEMKVKYYLMAFPGTNLIQQMFFLKGRVP